MSRHDARPAWGSPSVEGLRRSATFRSSFALDHLPHQAPAEFLYGESVVLIAEGLEETLCRVEHAVCRLKKTCLGVPTCFWRQQAQIRSCGLVVRKAWRKMSFHVALSALNKSCVLSLWLSFGVVKLLVDLVKPVVTEEALPGVFALGAKPVAQVS